MKYFLVAAKYQSVTMAGQAIHISPSAISTAISKIEEEFQCQVFRRDGKYIFLNDEGRILQKEFETIFDQIQLVKTKVNKAASFQGEFRLGGSHFLSHRYLSLAWNEAQKEHPGLRGELLSMHTALILSEVIKGTVDFALCFSPQQHPDFIQKELFKGNLRIAVRKGHPLLKLSLSQQLKALSQYPAILHKPTPGVEVCEKHPVFSHFGIQPKVRFYFDSDDQAIECILRSDSWTLIPDICYRHYAKVIQLLHSPKGWNAPYHICSVTPHHRAHNPVLQQLEQRIKELLHRSC